MLIGAGEFLPYILDYLNQCEKPVTFDHLVVALGVKKDAAIDAFLYRLKAMLRDGEIHQNRGYGRRWELCDDGFADWCHREIEDISVFCSEAIRPELEERDLVT